MPSTTSRDTFYPMYNIVLFVHIFAGVVWLGAGIAVILSIRSVLARDGQQAAVRFNESLTWTQWVFPLAAFLALGTGIAMVLMSSIIRFSDLWVVIALSLWVLSMGVGGGYGAKLGKQVVAEKEAGRQDTPEFRQLIEKSLKVHSWDMLIVVAILAMMVFRPVL